uniref:uncharacterized protein LOC122605799 n=1 Tax=Erigeron canadensis TaxID=72917 RepID=UPI001CB93EDC|nr:uncharacterized protein LOC122605799 [Erigeron canadensis]
MVSREHKKTELHEKLQLLRSITKSHAKSDSSIILDASKYIEELKHKVQRLNQDIENGQSSTHQNSLPEVTVEAIEKGIQVNLYLETSSPELLVYVLKVFEELSLSVLDAKISCTGGFHLEAVAAENEENGESIDAQMVKQSILHAIKNWSENDDDRQD